MFAIPFNPLEILSLLVFTKADIDPRPGTGALTTNFVGPFTSATGGLPFVACQVIDPERKDWLPASKSAVSTPTLPLVSILPVSMLAFTMPPSKPTRGPEILPTVLTFPPVLPLHRRLPYC